MLHKMDDNDCESELPATYGVSPAFNMRDFITKLPLDKELVVKTTMHILVSFDPGDLVSAHLRKEHGDSGTNPFQERENDEG